MLLRSSGLSPAERAVLHARGAAPVGPHDLPLRRRAPCWSATSGAVWAPRRSAARARPASCSTTCGRPDRARSPRAEPAGSQPASSVLEPLPDTSQLQARSTQARPAWPIAAARSRSPSSSTSGRPTTGLARRGLDELRRSRRVGPVRPRLRARRSPPGARSPGPARTATSGPPGRSPPRSTPGRAARRHRRRRGRPGCRPTAPDR